MTSRTSHNELLRAWITFLAGMLKIQIADTDIGRKEVWDGYAQGVWGTEVPSGVQGRSPGRGSGDEVHQKLKNFKSSYKQILRVFDSNSHTIHEIETPIIEHENYEAQLQSANSAPIRTTFIQRMKK